MDESDIFASLLSGFWDNAQDGSCWYEPNPAEGTIQSHQISHVKLRKHGKLTRKREDDPAGIKFRIMCDNVAKKTL